MVILTLDITLSDAALKGFQRALAPGQLPEELISLWVERHAMDWTGKLKGELQDQVNSLVAKYVDLPAELAVKIKSQIDAITEQLNVMDSIHVKG